MISSRDLYPQRDRSAHVHLASRQTCLRNLYCPVRLLHNIPGIHYLQFLCGSHGKAGDRVPEDRVPIQKGVSNTAKISTVCSRTTCAFKGFATSSKKEVGAHGSGTFVFRAKPLMGNAVQLSRSWYCEKRKTSCLPTRTDKNV